VKVREAHAATGKTTALSLGLHARYAPDTASGFHAFGQGQLGIEAGKMTHRIGIGNYSASNKSDWTGYSGMLAAGAGYRWAFDDTFSAGPIASLNYTTLSRPGVTESGPDASRLKLDSARFNSLRSSVGVSASLNKPLKNERLLKAELQLTWDRELLDKSVVQDASFVGYPGFGFSSRNKVTGRDSLGIGAALAYEAGKDLTLGARLSTNVFQKGNSSVAGNLSATWRF
jgi:outer membrane autotransporter protein